MAIFTYLAYSEHRVLKNPAIGYTYQCEFLKQLNLRANSRNKVTTPLSKA
jgi:hypothetical protein